jgi:predicted glycosyltransferase
MRILIDIGHPAHVHMFRCFAKEMQNRGSEVLFTCRDKEFEIKLLTAYGLNFINFGKKANSRLGKILDLIKFNWKEWRVACKFKPDIFLSHGSITASHIAWIMRKPSIAFEDTFNMEQIKLWKPFVTHILTSMYEHPLNSSKVIKYKGYNELLYLHPNKFIKDNNIFEKLNIERGEKYVVLRFVSWNATHDKGHTGISFKNKYAAVEEFSKYAKVYISSEKTLPEELEKYRIPLPAEDMHAVMANACLIFGESATMVTEGVMLGVPGIYLDNTGRLYTNDIEQKYEMCYNYSESEKDQIKAIQKGVELIKNNTKECITKRYKRLLDDNIDVTSFLTWFIENYPQSAKETKDNQQNEAFWKQFQ